MIAQGILYDGPTGATRAFWNQGVRVPWRNSLGDSVAAAVGTIAVPSFVKPTAYTLDIKTLAQGWLVFNCGLLLTAKGTAAFASRHNPTKALWPSLKVTTEAGAFDCPCTADAGMSFSTLSYDGAGPLWGVSEGATNVALQFDLSAVKGKTVASAVLTLWQMMYGPATISVYQLDPPKIFDPPPVVTQPEPAVLFSHDWPAPKGVYANDGSFTAPAYSVDPQLGKAVRFTFKPGVPAPCTLDHIRSAMGLAGLDEAWFRYQLRLESDWGTTLQNNKMPGLAGRYGALGLTANPLAYYTVCGNGGTACDGKAHPVGYISKPFLCGWSMRGQAFAKVSDSANPYANLTAICNYGYLANMPHGGGGDPLYGYGQEYLWRGVALEKGRVYSIVQHIKLNTVDMSAPDADGNGVGRVDGVFEVFIDGQKIEVLDPNNGLKPLAGVLYRHHPNIKIDNAWIDWYQGGTLDPVDTTSFSMGRVTLATSPLPALAAGASPAPQPPGPNMPTTAQQLVIDDVTKALQDACDDGGVQSPMQQLTAALAANAPLQAQVTALQIKITNAQNALA